MILLCYDGSPDALHAIDQAGGLVTDQPATVLTVWETFIHAMSRSGSGGGGGFFGVPDNVGEIDTESEQAAEQAAEEGAERARTAGLDWAQPSTKPRVTTVADTILSVADEIGADAIVLGTRGLSGIKSMLLGSVSHAVLENADRTVIVVPSPDVASERAADRTKRRS